jgi:hypothetical protein
MTGLGRDDAPSDWRTRNGSHRALNLPGLANLPVSVIEADGSRQVRQQEADPWKELEDQPEMDDQQGIAEYRTSVQSVVVAGCTAALRVLHGARTTEAAATQAYG